MLYSAPLAAQPAPETVGLTSRDIGIIARVLQFTIPPVGEDARLVVLFAAGDSAARADADRLVALLKEAVSGGRFNLRVEARDIARADYRTADVVVLSRSVALGSSELAAATAAAGAITISSSKSCAEAGYCVFAVSSEPYTNLWFSRAAARAAGLRFAPALQMLAKKL